LALMGGSPHFHPDRGELDRGGKKLNGNRTARHKNRKKALTRLSKGKNESNVRFPPRPNVRKKSVNIGKDAQENLIRSRGGR